MEADESAILSGENPGPHKIQGISAGFIPDTLDTKAYDGIVLVTSDDASHLDVKLEEKKASLLVFLQLQLSMEPLKLAKKLGTGKKVLSLAPDNGERYLSTALYEFEV